jgi:FAD:protein FMN transferase
MQQLQATDSFPALGGTAVVAVTEPVLLTLVRAEVEQTVEAFDRACSRFRSDSELSEVNRAAGVATHVSPVFLDAVRASIRAAQLTDGDVDPTVGGALVSLGYDRDFAQLRAGPITAMSVPGWRTVEVDADAGTVRLAPGAVLDLGATAKALAADRAAERARVAAGCGVLVSLSGDIALAGPPPVGGWRVRVTDDHHSGVDAPGQWITLQKGGLATSSATVRRWRTDDGDAHHLLDPATGAPACIYWRTVSVASGSCLDANIASTAAIVRGEAAAAWLDGAGLPSRLVRRDGAVTHVAGWPAAGDDLPVAETT